MADSGKITRRDFLNGTLMASGAALLTAACPFQLMAEPDWNGFSGIGDYAGANGNVHQVMSDGHSIRDHVFERNPAPVIDTHEIYDCVVVGGGISGLAAALFYQRATHAKKTCLVLENHPIFGGEAKRNEFEVDGQRLIASQGSAMWFEPLPGSFLMHFYDSIGIDPKQFVYQRDDNRIGTGVTPYAGGGSNFGFYFTQQKQWLIDPWGKKLAGAPIPDQAKRELLAMRSVPDHLPKPQRHGDTVSRHLDSITLEDDLIARHGLSRETVRKYLSPVSGGGSGLGADALSAYADYAADLLFPWQSEKGPQMFPGGNAGVARHMVKALLPDAIPGPATMANICRSRVNFAELDAEDKATRIRLRSTVISIEHEGDAAHAPHVNLVYLREGSLYRARARKVILANGSWTINGMVRDLPAEYRHAYAQFYRAPCIMANIALRNWKPLAKMGISQFQWFGGLGNYTAVRRVATFGGASPQLSPESPIILTVKILFSNPGRPLLEQVNMGRYQMMTTPFNAYEKQLRDQFSEMFSGYGFDAHRDLAGIILNRWGHAYLAPQPGFFFGKDGKPGPAELMRQKPFGRVAFANSDLSGIMDHRASIMEAHRAVGQVL
ncbi:NAD(P)-binding protein [Silvibacterium acidisoli]|uniref:NAD(P)-binding protein n=1 Tax=Acidobacteriaceae bacterium ZG23-2 TaxID=2883246 RepID=UPI00406C131D